MSVNRFCFNCGEQLLFYCVDPIGRSGRKLASAAKEKLKGYIDIIHIPQKQDGDASKGKCRFTVYDTSGRKWDKVIGSAASKSQVLYEGLLSLLDNLKRSIQIDLFTSDRTTANQINRKAGVPGDKNLLNMCEALRHWLPQFKGVAISYMPEPELKQRIRLLKSKAINRPYSLMGEDDEAFDDDGEEGYSPKYCFQCGSELPRFGLKLKAKAKTIPFGYIEHLFDEGNRKRSNPDASDSRARFRVFDEDENFWMYPLLGAATEQHAFWLGLISFLDKATNKGSAITLLTDDIRAVNALLDNKRETGHPDEVEAYRYARTLLRSRPLVNIKFVETRLLREKIAAIKLRLERGQKGQKIPGLSDE